MMSESPELSGPIVGFNRALARDLENLPLELIEQIIQEATFERVIQLSSWAGPLLTRAFAISPSWKHLLGTEEDRRTWQKCLRLTDNINVLCFDTRHGARPFFEERDPIRCWHADPAHCFCNKDVSFLQDGPSPQDYDAAAMRRRWLETLSARLSTTVSLSDLSLLEGLDHYLSAGEQTRFKQLSDIGRRSISADELENGIRLYQRALAARRTNLAGELRRLAALYEAHPRLLKVPFAPQISKPSTCHIPQQFRYRARKLENIPLTLHNRADCRTYFQDEWPALVPYDWTLRFFVTVMEKGRIPGGKWQFVLDGMPCYFLRKIEHASKNVNMRTIGTPWSLASYQRTQPEFLAGKDGPTRGRDGSYATHNDIELIWLETFVDIVADLIVRFPQDAEAAQAEAHLGKAEQEGSMEQLAMTMGVL